MIITVYVLVLKCDIEVLVFQVHCQRPEVCHSSDQAWSSNEHWSKTCVRFIIQVHVLVCYNSLLVLQAQKVESVEW